MDAQDHRIFLARLPADRLHQKAIDRPAVGALVGNPLDFRDIQLGPQLGIDVRQLPLAAAVERGSIDIVQVLEIVGDVSHDAGLFVDVESADAPLARRNGNGLASQKGPREKHARCLLFQSQSALRSRRPQCRLAGMRSRSSAISLDAEPPVDAAT